MTSQDARVRPAPGQESVWDYPRPPRLERVRVRIAVEFAGVTLADSMDGWRVLETSHPPTYYIPPKDVRTDLLRPAAKGSVCEFKGRATYWSIALGGRQVSEAAWTYPEPTAPFAAIRDHFAFYASRVDRCRVGEDDVMPQSGDFYGGWITARIVGPFKGGPGTLGW